MLIRKLKFSYALSKTINRRSLLAMFCEKAVLKYFLGFIGKHLRNPWFMPVAIWRTKTSSYKCFSKFIFEKLCWGTSVHGWFYIKQLPCNWYYLLRSLTHFRPVFPNFTPWKFHKTSGFLIFSRFIESEHGLKLIGLFKVNITGKWLTLIMILWSLYC